MEELIIEEGYKAKIISANHIEAHANADRLKLLHYGNEQFIIGLDVEVGETVVLFPADGQLSEDFCYHNNLYRDSALNKDTKVKGFFEDNRRVRIQPFRGEKSYGFVARLSSFSYLKKFAPEVGATLSEWNGKEICRKYFTPATLKAMRNVENNRAKEKKVKYDLEVHYKTKKMSYYPPVVRENTLAIITEKVHGTSARTGNILVHRKSRNILQWMLSGILKKFVGKESLEYELVSGTRRTICNDRLDITTEGERDYYRWEWHNKIAPLLHKGETVYYEICGYDNWGATIMESQFIGDRRDTVPTYWDDNMVYSYGCEQGENKAFVYRITQATPSGEIVELPWSRVASRSKELALDVVPVLKFFIPSCTEELQEVVSIYMVDGDSTLDNRHMLEGVCVRLESETSTEVLKEKNFLFGVLEGYQKEQEDYVDIEEVN